MNARFSEKTFIVTGGTSGMGSTRCRAKQLVDEGAKVIITGRNETALANTTQKLGSNAIPFVSDAGDLADIQSLIHFLRKKHLANGMAFLRTLESPYLAL